LDAISPFKSFASVSILLNTFSKTFLEKNKHKNCLISSKKNEIILMTRNGFSKKK
jgi:hypothetical protein